MEAPSWHLNSLVWRLHYSLCLATMILGSSFLFSKRERSLECQIPPAYTVIIRSFPLFTLLFWIHLAAYVTCLVLQVIWYHPQTLFFQAQFCIPGEHMKCFQLLFPNSDMGFCSTFFHRLSCGSPHEYLH